MSDNNWKSDQYLFSEHALCVFVRLRVCVCVVRANFHFGQVKQRSPSIDDSIDWTQLNLVHFERTNTHRHSTAEIDRPPKPDAMGAHTPSATMVRRRFVFHMDARANVAVGANTQNWPKEKKKKKRAFVALAYYYSCECLLGRRRRVFRYIGRHTAHTQEEKHDKEMRLWCCQDAW